jgi:uncharacterized membrane protein YkvA (DUF1232 family)
MVVQFLKENFILVLSLVYIVSPVDFIPEIFLGPLGIIDDLALVVFLLLMALLKRLHKKPSKNDVIEGEII